MKLSGGVNFDKISINNLNDVLIDKELKDQSFLTYDAFIGQWINKSYDELFTDFIGAQENIPGISGLVPAPKAGETSLFLRSDGEWAPISSTAAPDNKTVETASNGVLKLKDFGVKYYKYIPESENQEAHYIIQMVDEDHPWAPGLEPRVVLENNELVLGWFEPNPTTIEGVHTQVSSLQNTVVELQHIIGTPGSSLAPASGIFASLNEKINKSEVYTKTQTDEKIKTAIVESAHLGRKIVTSLEDIEEYIKNHNDAHNYIFMVPSSATSSNNKYDEYIVIEGVIEQVGNWEVNLNDYATKIELSHKVDKADGFRLFAEAEANKLAGLANIRSVSTSAFSLSPEGHLEFKGDNVDISNNPTITLLSSKVSNIENNVNLNSAAIKSVEDKVATNVEKITLIQGNISSISDELNSLKTNTSNAIRTLNDEFSSIQSRLSDYVTTDIYEADIEELRNLFIWKDIS